MSHYVNEADVKRLPFGSRFCKGNLKKAIVLKAF